MTKHLLYLLFALCLSNTVWSQTISDSTNRKINLDSAVAHKKDTSKSISPRRAAIRSAIIPGWGQVSVRKDLDASFFRKYYSIPIIYGAIGTTVGMFAYNLTWYRRTRYAYKVLFSKDTLNYPKIHKKLQYYVATDNASSL
ncbi:MAG: hypothetical protein JWP88_2161, partial [Flaviaesturariibacter sp.]|nr:hypothetical protein [Flaviaesturariibacter sp.]